MVRCDSDMAYPFSMESTKHSLIGLLVVAGGLYVSLGSPATTCWYPCLVALVVILQVGVFLYYDTLVRDERQSLLRQLQASERHVEDHFPESVRGRLEQAQQAHCRQQPHQPPQSKENAVVSCCRPAQPRDDPVWDLHPEATVLFADLKGFTKWSNAARRSPDDVFRLLETLYSAFDRLAEQHRVYKIETVGDCYVCVTGAPSPDPHHAQNMAEFARALLERSTQILQEMESTLPGAAELELRVGLHSGPVVLGVLRCARQRLQIFGNTVNTASRMESTGWAGRIQISAATANLLALKHGKEHWFQRRSDSVVAKGLGRLNTYWLVHKSPSSSSSQPQSAAVEREATSSVDFLQSLVLLTEQQQERASSSAKENRPPRLPHRRSRSSLLLAENSSGEQEQFSSSTMPSTTTTTTAGIVTTRSSGSKLSPQRSHHYRHYQFPGGEVPPRPSRSRLFLSARSRSTGNCFGAADGGAW